MLRNKLVRTIVGFSSTSKRFAGHSKWANIKHIKGQKDGERSLLFTRLSQRMKVAIQEGGGANPETNPLLAQAIINAKRNDMPVVSIQNYIKSCQGAKDKQQVVMFEIRGPRNSFLVVKTLTDAPKRTRDNIASMLRRFGGQFAENSSKNIFEHKGIIIATPKVYDENALEKAIDDAIECGAEEVAPAEEEGDLVFTCGMGELLIIKTKLESKNYKISSADIDFIPKVKAELSDDEMMTLSKMLHKIEEIPEIVRVYDNVA